MSSDNQYTALGPAIIGFQTDSTRDHNDPTKRLGAGVVGMSDRAVPVPIDTPGLVPLPDAGGARKERAPGCGG